MRSVRNVLIVAAAALVVLLALATSAAGRAAHTPAAIQTTSYRLAAAACVGRARPGCLVGARVDGLRVAPAAELGADRQAQKP